MKKLILILFLITSQIFATDYYISSSSGNDGNTGLTEAQAWANLTKLLTLTLTSGDRVLLQRGDTWSPTSAVGNQRGALQLSGNKQGTAGNPIIIDAYGSGALPRVEDNTTSLISALEFWAGVNHITVQNIHFVGPVNFYLSKAVFGASTGVHNVKLLDCEFTDGRIGMVNNLFQSPIALSNVPASNDPYTNPIYKIEIGRCTGADQRSGSGDDWMNFIFGVRYIDENGLPTTFAERGQLNLTTGAMPDTNFWIHDNDFRNSWSEILDLPGGNLHLIERNVFAGSRLYGNVFKMHSEYSMITDCIIRDNLVVGSAYDSPTGSTAFGFALESSQRCIIENNTLSSRYPAIFGDNENTGNSSLYGTFKDNIIRNNNFYGAVVIYGVPNVGTWGYTHDQEDSIAHLNTFTGNNYWDNSQWTEAPKVIKVYNNDSKNLTSNGSLGGSFDNVWIGTTVSNHGATYPTTNEQRMNPQMVNPVWVSPYNAGTYSVNTGSPLIDSGSPTGNDHIYDINLDVRTQGIVDIGAYETSNGAIRPRFTVSAYSGGTYTAPTFNYGTVQPSETKTGFINLTNISPDSTIDLESVTLSGAFDSLFTFVNAYSTSGLPSAVTLPYKVPVGETVRLEIEFNGSTATGSKTASLAIAHSSTVQTSPLAINLSATVSDVSVVFAISGDSTKIFTSALGAERLTNWDLASWSATDPVGWTIQGEDVLPSTANSVNETSTGSGVAKLKSDGTYVSMKQYSVTTSGGRYLLEIDVDAVTLGYIKLVNGGLIDSWTSAGVTKQYFVADGSSTAFERGSSSGNTEVDVNYISIKQITSSWDATATITNSGSGTLTTTGIALVDGTDFSITSATTFSIDAGLTFDLTYSFAPTDTGYFQDTIRISGINASNKSTYDIPIEGYFETAFSPTATKNLKTVGLSGSTFALATVDTGSTSADSVQFYNDGDGDLTLDSLVWSGGDYTQFNLLTLTTDDTTLSAGDTTDLGVQFAPTTSGVKTAYLAVYHNGDNIVSPLVITVTGQATVIQTEPYVVFLNPPSGSLSFGGVDVNTTTQAMIIWRNDGDETYNYQVTQSFGTVFDYYSGGLNDSTQTDELDTLIYTFTPDVAGSHSDTLKFAGTTSNLSDPYTIILSGTGIPSAAEFEIDYSYYNFGVQDTSDADTLTITITDGGAGVLSGVISLPTSEQFTLLNGGAYSTYTTKTFQVIAQPTDEMYYEIDVTITHNATNVTSPQTVTLAVTGDVVSKLAVLPTNYHFGSVYLGDVETSSNLIAYNKGRDTIAVDSIYLATNSVFTLADTLGATLPGNLVYNGGFDRTDTLWTLSAASISSNKLSLGTSGIAIQDLTDLKPSTAYLIVMDISGHTGTGDRLQYTLGGSGVILDASDYTNGTLAIQAYSGRSNSSIRLQASGGTGGTLIDNITVSEYTATQVTFTPVAGTTSNVDNLSYEHNDANSLTANPLLLPITGYMTSGGITINGNIEVNTVKKK